MEKDHKERLDELENTKRLLTRYDNQLDGEKREAAYRALDEGETTLAQALLKELARQASARREDAAQEEAEFEFKLGKLAEQEVRWHDAYTHYNRAAARHETVDHLNAYSRMTWRLAKGDEAVAANKKLVDLAQADHGPESAEYATQINNLGEVLRAQGRYAEAETLLKQALEIDRAPLGVFAGQCAADGTG